MPHPMRSPRCPRWVQVILPWVAKLQELLSLLAFIWLFSVLSLKAGTVVGSVLALFGVAYRLYKGDFRPGFFAIGFPVLMTLMVPLVYADINGFNQHWADVDINSGLFLICLCSVVAKKPALMEFFPEEKKALVHLPFMMKTAYTVTAIWMAYFLAIIGINLLVIWYEVSGTQSSKGTRAAFALIPTVSLIALAFCISPRLLVFFEEFYRLRDENGGGRARSLSSMLVD